MTGPAWTFLIAWLVTTALLALVLACNDENLARLQKARETPALRLLRGSGGSRGR